MSDDTDPMADIKASFFIECEELLESLQDGLEAMSDGETDDETINVVFRAVHSIKGGAGAFGLDELVQFAHRYETALDEVRAHRLVPDAAAMKLFFQCADVLSDLVRCARDGESCDPAAVAALLDALEELVGAEAEENEVSEDDFQPLGLSFDLDLPDAEEDGGDAGEDEDPTVYIRFEPMDGLFASGNEPQHLLRALQDLGEMEVQLDLSDLPPLSELNPEAAYAKFDISLKTHEENATITEVFDFVDGLCKLELSDVPLAPAQVKPAPPSPAEAPPAPRDTGGDAGDDATPGLAQDSFLSTASERSGGSAPTVPKATVRVDLARIDRLVNLVGELVINQAMISQSVAEAGIPASSSLTQGLEEFQQLTRDIQDSVMMIRAQPVKSLFQRMSRIVREASTAINKNVRLRTDGEATEVDKTVIERLADPLTHMIRNAVDHGLEKPADRVAAGKPAEGVVSLTAGHRSGRVVIEVRDDGAGIDRERVQQIAEEKGLIPPDALLSESEIDNLLFLPGFSTAKEVSKLSGRGVGMDVVKSSIQALGGRIAISSIRGQGTTFTISLPLTLAVLDGMVVRVAGETLVLPLNAIMETFTLSTADIRRLGPETQVVHVRDRFVPLLDLGAELGYRAPLPSYVGSIVLLIAHEDGSQAAIIADSIEDQRQVVIKGLHESYGRIPGVAAATILGDGQIALILDPVDITSNATGRTRSGDAALSLAG